MNHHPISDSCLLSEIVLYINGHKKLLNILVIQQKNVFFYTLYMKKPEREAKAGAETCDITNE